MKTTNWKRYEQVDELRRGKCDGCVGIPQGSDLCVELRDVSSCTGKIWKEIVVEKTALELVELVIQDCCPGSPPFCRAVQLKAAIEREQAELVNKCLKIDMEYFKRLNQHESAIRMQPISELPDRVPDGCVVVLIGPDAGQALSMTIEDNDDLHDEAKYYPYFYILPLPVAPRKLHPCYMPGCGGEAETVTAKGGLYRVKCSRCGARGPYMPTKKEAEKAWGYNEQA